MRDRSVLNAGRPFMFRPEFMWIQSAIDRGAPKSTLKPVTRSRLQPHAGLVNVSGWCNDVPRRPVLRCEERLRMNALGTRFLPSCRFQRMLRPMIRSLLLLIGSLLGVTTIPAAEVLIVADEFPAMQFLAEKLKYEENLSALVVAQDNLPPELKPFRAVVVYIHGELKPPTEESLIRYTQAGGRLVLLHHSISSGKRKNRDWFPFLGIDLLTGDVTAGGYKWIEPATLDLVKLAPDHFITTHRVNYPGRVAFQLPDETDPPADRPAFTLTESEVYLNHTFTRPRIVLLGFRYIDHADGGKAYQQDTAGWVMAAGQGQVVYLKAGHSQRDFEHPTYLRIVLNAVIFSPTAVSTASP